MAVDDLTANNESAVNLRPLVPQPNGRGALRPFRKGESGNPTGRRKKYFTDSYTKLAKSPVPASLREKLRKKGIELPEKARMSDAVAVGMTLAAIAGFAPPAKEIADRVEGKVVEAVTEQTAVGITINIRKVE